MRRMLKSLLHALARLLRGAATGLLALLILFEEWGWEPLQRAMAWLARAPLLRQIEALITRLPPALALGVFLLPSLLLLPVKLAALWLLAHGHELLGLGIVRSLGFEIRAQNGGDPDGREFGYGANLSGSFKLFENDQILWQVVAGRGIANYMNDGGTDLAPNGDLNEARAVPSLGWLLYYNRQWSERWTSSIGLGEHRQFNTSGQSDDAFERGQLAQVNLLFHPTPDMYVGPEYIWGRRENNDGEDGMDNRVQISFHYNFGVTVFGPRGD